MISSDLWFLWFYENSPFTSKRSLPLKKSWYICRWYFQIFDKSQCRGELSCAAQKTRRLNGCVAVVLYSYRLLEDRRSKEVKLQACTMGLDPFLITLGGFKSKILNPKPCSDSHVLIKSVDFKKTVTQSSFLSKVLSFLLTLFWFQWKWRHFWKKWGLLNCLFKMNGL